MMAYFSVSPWSDISSWEVDIMKQKLKSSVQIILLFVQTAVGLTGKYNTSWHLFFHKTLYLEKSEALPDLSWPPLEPVHI